MATPSAPSENTDVILTISFNQDGKTISVGHHNGYMFYKTPELLENTSLMYEGETSSNPHLRELVVVERLYSSSLIVMVSQIEPRVMRVYHYATRNYICDHRFNKSVLNVKLNRERIVVCTEDCIYIYNLKDMKSMHSIQDTPLNQLGIIDLSLANSNIFLAYPGSAETGSVHIFDPINLSSVNTFVAHDGPLAAIKFNSDGTKLATASTKGTVIRVYGVPHGERLFEFRRGMSRYVSIHSLAFSPDSNYLCSSSNTETVHVFKLEKTEEHQTEAAPEPSSWFGMFNKKVNDYMPSQVTELITTERSFATAKLPGVTKRNLVTVLSHKQQNYVVVATSEGFVYCYRLDPAGGELDLVKQHKIGPGAEGTMRGPASSVGNSDSDMAPNVDDPDDFPPMTHSSG
ncbi:unnamed protein product [Caenorhabditis bovis]|uniref:WD repeat domain phosphoinositide-interacting protein 2 n=1 Tax=Caenorhabditis bovis TaxID=2654633 RepID=A0A8S1E422_9PELO|nr:unnamed protein product [Caenorhabditis bovis]